MSAHFAVLREADLVEAERNGRTIVYRLKMSVLEDALLGFAHAFGLEGEADEADGLDSDTEKRKP